MNNFQVMDVKNNKFLHAAFFVRKAELLKSYSANDCQTEILIHATSQINVSSILKNNLNWRYVRRAKYGFGVSFSHDSKYANKYCNNKNGNKFINYKSHRIIDKSTIISYFVYTCRYRTRLHNMRSVIGKSGKN